MICIDGYQDFNISDYIKIADIDRHDYDQILKSNENIIVIKEFSGQAELLQKWEETMYFVAGYLQNKLLELDLNDKYMWNIYIAYLINGSNDLNLKLSIERNKFCCKKYVVDWNGYSSKEEALLNEVPILANIDFKIEEDIFLNEDKEIKKLICMENINAITNIFIEVDNIERIEPNYLIDSMMEILNGK